MAWVDIYFSTTARLKYDGPSAEDTNVLIENEAVRVFKCTFQSTGTIDETVPPFSFDRTGQLILEDYIATWTWASWQSNGATVHQLKIGTGDKKGLPNINITGNAGFTSVETIIGDEFYTCDGKGTVKIANGDVVHYYLVVTDTRVVDPTTRAFIATTQDWVPTAGAPIFESAAVYIASETVSPMASLDSAKYSVNYDRTSAKKLTLGAMTATAPGEIASWTTTDGQVLTDKTALDAYFSPSTDAIVAETDATTGKPTGNLSLKASTQEDVITYALWTTNDLSDAKSWMSADEWIAGLTDTDKVRLKNVLEMDGTPWYNRLRIDEEGSVIPLPRLDGEMSRFYRLVGE